MGGGALKQKNLCTGFCQELVNGLLDDTYEACTGRITLHKQSEKFPIRQGVQQGDTISPELFTACLERVCTKLEWENAGLRIHGEYLGHLRSADCMVALLSESAELQKRTEELRTESFTVGLKINRNKSKVMINKHAECVLFSIGNDTLEQVEGYNHLGQVVGADPNYEKELWCRIGMKWGTLGKHSQIM